MYTFAKLRQWVNRDNGRFYCASNRRLGTTEVVGLLLFVVALVLWQFHAKAGISLVWSIACGAVGLLLARHSAREFALEFKRGASK